MRRNRSGIVFVCARPIQHLPDPRALSFPSTQLSVSTFYTAYTVGNHIRPSEKRKTGAFHTLPIPPFPLLPSHLLSA